MGNTDILQSLTRRAANEDITILPLPERCRLIRDFSNALIKAANDPARISQNEEPEDVDETTFEPEVRVLRRFAHTLSYSDTFHSWMQNRQNILLARMNAKKPPFRLCVEWQHANEARRRGMVTQILNDQCSVFGEDIGFTVRAPNIKWLTGARKRTLGKVEFFDFQSMQEHQIPAIEIRRDLFEKATPDNAVTIAQHETLHYLLFLLAMAAYSGAIKGRHPLYGDAQMELEKIKAGAIISPQIYSAYRAQPEERLCFGIEERMKNGWLSPR